MPLSKSQKPPPCMHPSLHATAPSSSTTTSSIRPDASSLSGTPSQKRHCRSFAPVFRTSIKCTHPSLGRPLSTFGGALSPSLVPWVVLVVIHSTVRCLLQPSPNPVQMVLAAWLVCVQRVGASTWFVSIYCHGQGVLPSFDDRARSCPLFPSAPFNFTLFLLPFGLRFALFCPITDGLGP